LGNYKERRLKKLKDMVAAQEIELEEMRQEIRELEQAIQKEKAAAVAQKPEMAAQQETTE
jgi:soluble cytochrome b562